MEADKGKNGFTPAARLRRRAEDQLNENSPEAGIASPDVKAERLIHELQIHQIELEMQNSELQQARDELEIALEKYTDLYDFAPVGYFTFNSKGVISAVNLTGASILGSERASLLGRHFGLFVTEESRPLFAGFLMKVFVSQSKMSCEVTLATAGNLSLVVQIDAVVFGPGQECRAVLMDITARRKAEQKLQESEERLRLALSAANLAAWDWDLPSGTIIWNDEHYRMLGYEPGGIVPSYRAWTDRMHPDDIVATEARIRESMAAGSAYAAEFRIRWPDGTVRWLEALGEFTCDAAGQPLRSYGVMMDRTSQTQAEAALQQAYHELTDANVDLEAFNYSVSHDLRTPLTVISGYCQMVQESCGSSLDERCRGYLGEIYDGTLRMTRLVETLLDFSSVTRSEMHHEKVDLSKMAEEVAMILQENGPQRRVTFRIAAGITADGDAVLLRSVLDNLLGNAWKYSGNCEGAIIEFGVTERDGKSTWFVKDNGPGFDSAHLDKMFLPFQRLPGTKVGGHGIGLATVDRIIRRHGGRVWADGEPGKGACFYFTLGAVKD